MSCMDKNHKILKGLKGLLYVKDDYVMLKKREITEWISCQYFIPSDYFYATFGSYSINHNALDRESIFRRNFFLNFYHFKMLIIFPVQFICHLIRFKFMKNINGLCLVNPK